MIKYLYIVDYWVPFPHSEYGGVINVIAENEDECFDFLSNEDEPFHNHIFLNLIKPAIHKAQKLTLTDNYQSGICLLYTSPSPRDRTRSRMPSSA